MNLRILFSAGLLSLTVMLLAGCERKTFEGSSAAAPTVPKAESSFTPAQLGQRAAYRRAVEAAIWGVPAVNFELMVDGLTGAKGGWNQIVYWSRLPDWKNQTLTPNPDVIYIMPYYDTRSGPVVLEIPPAVGGSITGSVDDGWQTAIEDVGPAGVDKGRGGKYLILPPGYSQKVPAGFIPMPSSTFNGYALLRSNIGSGSKEDIAKAVSYAQKIQLYPFAETGKPAPTRFIDVSKLVYDSTIPYDLHFFEKLDRFVQREPWLERDKAMIDALKTIGIEKGKSFAPDDALRSTLQDAIKEAHAWLENAYEAAFTPPYFDNSHWAVPVSPSVLEGLATNYSKPDSYPIGGRGVTYSFGFFSAKHLGHGQFYLLSMQDKDGHALDGGTGYHLRVPPNAPVKLYWSATVYDRATHALIRDKDRASRASTSQGLQRNADGSVDLYFGPQAPQGKDSNWIPTRADGRFEVLFRLYGPEQPLFDKTWQLPDIEAVRSSG